MVPRPMEVLAEDECNPECVVKERRDGENCDPQDRLNDSSY